MLNSTNSNIEFNATGDSFNASIGIMKESKDGFTSSEIQNIAEDPSMLYPGQLGYVRSSEVQPITRLEVNLIIILYSIFMLIYFSNSVLKTTTDKNVI